MPSSQGAVGLIPLGLELGQVYSMLMRTVGRLLLLLHMHLPTGFEATGHVANPFPYIGTYVRTYVRTYFLEPESQRRLALQIS